MNQLDIFAPESVSAAEGGVDDVVLLVVLVEAEVDEDGDDVPGDDEGDDAEENVTTWSHNANVGKRHICSFTNLGLLPAIITGMLSTETIISCARVRLKRSANSNVCAKRK